MFMPRALLSVFDSLIRVDDPTAHLIRNLRMEAADLDDAVTALTNAQSDAERRAGQLRRMQALRQMIDSLAELEVEWSRQ